LKHKSIIDGSYNVMAVLLDGDILTPKPFIPRLDYYNRFLFNSFLVSVA